MSATSYRPYYFILVKYTLLQRQDDLKQKVCYLYFRVEYKYAEVTHHNSEIYNIICLLYFTSLFRKPNSSKRNKHASIIVYNIPCNLFYIQSAIPQNISNIECLIYLPHLILNIIELQCCGKTG